MPPINRNMNRPIPFMNDRIRQGMVNPAELLNRKEEAAVPEANQQLSMHAMGNPLPDEQRTQHMTMMPPMPAAGTVVSAVVQQEMQRKVIGKEEVRKAKDILRKYKDGKANLEARIVDDELWWELRHWESIGKDSNGEEKKNSKNKPKPTSAWLVNSIVNKHADAMDNFPEPLVLPREEGDEEAARTLSSVLPVVMEYNDFEDVYRENWWEKLKHGTAAYGVFWNSKKENGLGDIDIKSIDLLKLFWEPGVQNIQNSRNLFILELVDTDLLEEEYPGPKGRFENGENGEIEKYMFQDTVDITGKSCVVDWYYKKTLPGGRTVLHYCKFSGDEVLYASENDPKCAERGFYDHGKYPVVLDVLFPEKGTPIGFGYVAIAKDPQLYIDELSSNLLRTSMMGSRKRWLVSSATNINMEDYADWNKELVRVEGEIDERRLREIQITPPAPIYAQIMQMKIEEMKDTSNNRDVNSGSASAGVTSGAAIAALQESGNKQSRDGIRTSYKAYGDVLKLVIDLIRQFYNVGRAFRITGANDGEYKFINVSNRDLKNQYVGPDSQGNPLFRKPVFDLKISAQKRNPFSVMEGNQRASELYAMGFFDPNRSQEAMAALEMMEFEGIDKVRKTVQQGHTLQNMLMEANELIQQLASMVGLQQPGMAVLPGGTPAPQGQPSGIRTTTDDHRPRTSYQNNLASKSSPNMDFVQQAANPIRR